MEKREVLLNSGYKTGFYPQKVDSNFYDIISFLLANDLRNTAHYTKTKLKDIINDTETFYGEFFESVNSVLTVGKDTVGIYPAIDKATDNSSFEGMNLLVKEYSPFQIPIILRKSNNPFLGSLRRIGIANQDFKPFTPFIITHINISKPFTTYSPICYAHEIMHSQVDSQYGAITNYHNREVLPIFIEKLMAYHTNIETFREIEKARLTCLRNGMCKSKEDFNNEDYIYFNSTLIAEALFDAYINSSDADRKVIIEYIQLIIDGEITLEEFLEGFNITYESSLNTSAMKRNLHLE